VKLSAIPGIGICNYPIEADSWNRKNMFKGADHNKWEGEVDVIISGKVYAISDYTSINGSTVTHIIQPISIDLTSITKVQTINN
jgi:hypothetical protein